MWFDWHHSMAGEVVRHDSVPARLAGAGWVAWFYAGKALWPANLCVIYPRWQVDAGSAVAWVPLVGFAAVCVALWKRRGAFLSVASYVALLFPVLGFIDVSFMAYSYVADHWQYMAMIPVIALVCAAGVNTAVRWQWRWWPMVAAAVIAALGIGTWRQTHVWRDEETLWRSTIARNPKAWMAHNNLGNALLKRGLPVEAAQEYAETIRLQPDYANAHYNLGIVLYQRGDIAAATGEFRETIHLKPRSAEAHNNLGAALVQLGRTNEAVAEFQTASQIAPRWEEPKDNLARLRTAH
jgi:tetratricopeptide (TPR) repeat protein